MSHLPCSAGVAWPAATSTDTWSVRGGTHAWIEVVSRAPGGAQVTAVDSCHARRVDGCYVTVATGRDEGDVPSTSGCYGGPARGVLTGARELLVEPIGQSSSGPAPSGCALTKALVSA